jgi:uncharacterized membrane protein YpjA
MASGTGVRDSLRAVGGPVPDREDLPRYVSPLPAWLENIGLGLAWTIVGINLLGTLFGFWYYRFQFASEPIVLWPFVPDSPLATLFIASSLAAWKLGRSNELLNTLAFFGCIKLGAWTPYVLLAFDEGFSYLHPAMYNFLFWSHLAMVVQAFLIHRYSDFRVWAIVLALAWYTVDLVLDYFVPVLGDPHHTAIPVADDAILWGGASALGIAAAGAVVLTLAATVLALATRIEKLRARSASSG